MGHLWRHPASRIQEIRAREILDSRGNPTVEVSIWTEGGVEGIARVPSGASTGSYEALELRDQDPDRFHGKGVQKAVANIHNVIAPALIGKSVLDQQEIDRTLRELDGTSSKSRLGANAILAVSLASAHCASQHLGIPLFQWIGGISGGILPVPLVNVLNGGKHADNPLDIQECMLVPLGFERFADALRATVEVFHTLRALLKDRGYSTAIGDEGGFAPPIQDIREALQWLCKAVEKTGYRLMDHFYLALDIAATELLDPRTGTYQMNGKSFTPEQWLNFWENLLQEFPIFSVEDIAGEDDWTTWRNATQRFTRYALLVGDDLFVTSPERLQRGIQENVASAILVKPNQIGTLTETLQVIHLAQVHAYQTIISHRSGETEDTTIADIAVGTRALLIKTGSVSRTDRTAKYNRLLWIEDFLGKDARYAGPLLRQRILHP